MKRPLPPLFLLLSLRNQIKQMIAYLGTVKLCGTRTAEHPCPP
jgi:hypothetical protein